MRNVFLVMVVVTVSAAMMLAQNPAPYRAPRTADGKPSLNGIWQTFGDANWDIEPHAAAAPPIALTGAIGATPPGLGIVEGG
ncbi:MAG TPA: hypothetical protein VMB70_11960, partial [Terriglobia bacterium]|nr:hypothetical protein [Terriglobia bacterium]